jgi:3-hydroxybutyryl-CoA dehydratase
MDDVRLRLDGLTGYCLEDLSVGMTACLARTVTEADVILFAGVSGDSNPVHLNQVYAEKTRFKSRIVHGMLSAGFISATIATRLPGPGSVYVSQNLVFKVPVRIGDTVEARVTVADIIPERKRVSLHTTCTVGDTVVIEGEACVLVPPRTC